MIWDWVNSLALFIRKLFAFPDIPLFIPAIDPNAPCPSCGHRDGFLKAVIRDQKPMVEHRCRICGMRWWESPVLRDPVVAGSAVRMEVSPESAAAPAKE